MVQVFKAQTQPKKKSGFFALPQSVRLLIYLPFFAVYLIFTLRQLENRLVYQARPYQPGPQWSLPANGEDVWFKARDGSLLHGWFVRAARQPARATILHFHGAGGDITDFARVIEYLGQHGFDTLAFDYRGYGRSGGKFTDEWGLYDDGTAAYDYLTGERKVKAEGLVLYGMSLGTAIAIDLAARRPCAALVVESGPSSMSEMASFAVPWLPRWLHFVGHNQFESVRKIAAVRSPLLVTHGTQDDTVPLAQGQRLFAAAPEPKRLLLIEGGSHYLAFEGKEKYLNQVVAFLQAQIK